MINCLRLLTALSLASLFTACFKEDDKVVLEGPGDARVTAVAMGSDYQNQIFFSMRNGVVLTNNHAAWDLAFESAPAGYHVWLNGGKGMLAAAAAGVGFAGTTSLAYGPEWKWDEASWNPDSTAIGNWMQDATRVQDFAASPLRTDETGVSRKMYIVDRGDGYANVDRYWKIVIQYFDESGYRVKYGRLNSGEADSLEIQKDPQQAYTYFTFDNGGQQITMEPAVDQWDVVFTRHRHIFYNTQPPTPYAVSGVLLNPNGVSAALDSVVNYDNIDLAFAQNMPLTARRNVIGYNWKYYDFTALDYKVKPHFNYVIKDRDGFYWKLRFLDFYNAQGEKGHPKFEFQRL